MAKEAEKAAKEATKEAEKAQSVPTLSVSAVEAPAGASELSPAETKVAAKKRRLEKAAADRKAAEDCIRSKQAEKEGAAPPEAAPALKKKEIKEAAPAVRECTNFVWFQYLLYLHSIFLL